MEPASSASNDSYQVLTFLDKENISSYVVFLYSFSKLVLSPLLYNFAAYLL